MELLTNWFKGNMGTPGDYSYRPIHWYTIAAIAVITIIAVIWQLQLNGGKKAGKLITTIAWIQLVFEIGWRLIYLLFHHTPWAELWPSYPCNLGGILIPLIALTDWKTGKKMFYLFALVGAVLTFSIPDGIFTSNVFVFPIFKSVMQHTGILLIPVLEYIRGTYRPSLIYHLRLRHPRRQQRDHCPDRTGSAGGLYVLPRHAAFCHRRCPPIYHRICLRPYCADNTQFSRGYPGFRPLPAP